MIFNVDNHEVYAATGNRKLVPGNPCVVFLHGAGQDHTIWVLPTRYFARHGYNVLAVDLPGHGRSGGDPIKTVEDLSEWVIRVLDSAGLAQTALVGHSLGSLVAIAAAANHPDRIRSIALVGSTVPMPVSEYLLNQASENRHAAIEFLNFLGLSKAAQLGGNATPGNWMLGAGIRLMEKAAPGVIYHDLKACNDYRDGLAHAAMIRCPALLIFGDRDRLTPPRFAKNLSKAIENSEVVIFPGAGHALLAERPDPLLDQLIRIV
jgi:pimeloyl-ACP methyl ester carboxylesterase